MTLHKFLKHQHLMMSYIFLYSKHRFLALLDKVEFLFAQFLILILLHQSKNAPY